MLASRMGDHGPQDFNILLELQVYVESSGVSTVLVIILSLAQGEVLLQGEALKR